MKITNSSVAMASAHQESSFTYKESVTMEAAKSKDAAGAILTLSAEATGKTLKESMAEYQKQEEQKEKQRKKENEARSMQRMADRMRNQPAGMYLEMSDEYDMQIKMLRQMLALLRGEKVPEEYKIKPQEKGNVLDLRSAEYRKADNASLDLRAKSVVSLSAVQIGTNASGTTWQRITATSGFVSESESTTSLQKGLCRLRMAEALILM